MADHQSSDIHNREAILGGKSEDYHSYALRVLGGIFDGGRKREEEVQTCRRADVL